MDVLWSPTSDSIAATQLGRFAAWVGARRGLDFGTPADYDAIWRWSTSHVEQFWGDVATWTGVLPGEPDDQVLSDRSMPGAMWFPGRHVNYAEHALLPALDGRAAPASPALVAVAEDTGTTEISWASLRRQVGAFAATLRRLGVQRGDRVAGYLPNIPEAVIAFLGTASIGAVWSACSPDFGPRSVLDRFAQIEPAALVAIDGYQFNGRRHDRRSVVAELRAALPSIRATIAVGDVPDGAVTWADAVADHQEPTFEQLPFDHPLWIVYSSGTTGTPKGIVHGHGGIVLEQLKSAQLHLDIKPGDRYFWYASTAWIMWNIATSALLSAATVVVYDGAPGYPTLDAQFALAARTGVSFLGTSAGYLSACEKAGLRPGKDHDLSALRGLGSTGSPLPTSTFRWVYDAVSPDVPLTSISGGTDVATGFIGASPLLPVTAGELQRPMLGVAATAWDEHGQPRVGQVGELVVTAPMPSMPLRFWNDPDGSRYRDAYFQPWPGVWRHGDWMTVTDRGTCVITGRSDATLNRAGVRMGTADIYAAVESIPAVADCLVLGVEQPDGGYWMPLFVHLAPGCELTQELTTQILAAIRANASPRHLPDEILAVPGVPHTRTGKRLEVPIKRLFQGIHPAGAVNPDSVDDPDLIEFYVELARRRSGVAT